MDWLLYNNDLRYERVKSYLNVDKITFKDPRREKAPSNRTSVLTKCTNMDIWVVGTSNQILIRGS